MRRSIVALVVAALTLLAAVPASAHSLREHCLESDLPEFICEHVPDRDHG